MLWLSLFFFLLVSGDNCSNPMFAVPVVFPTKQHMKLSLLNETQNQSDFGFCQELNGLPSCCNEEFATDVRSEIGMYDYQLKTWAKQVQTLDSQTLVDIAAQGLGWQLNSAQMSLAIKIADGYKLIVGPTVRAAGGLLGYFQGMLCFACHPDWSLYLGGTNYSVLNLTQATCEGVWLDVMDYTNAMQAELIEVTYLLAEIMKLDANQTYFAPFIRMMETAHAILLSTSWCTLFGNATNCHDYVCQDVLSGAYYPYDFLPSLTGIEVGPNLLAHLDYFSSHFEKLQEQALLAADADDDGDDPLKPNYTYIVQNQYLKGGGFPAFRIGCSNPVSEYACPPPQSPSSDSFDWKLFLIVSLPVLTLFIALIAIFLCRRKHSVESVPLDDDVRYHHLRDSSSGGSSENGSDIDTSTRSTLPRESPGTIQ